MARWSLNSPTTAGCLQLPMLKRWRAYAKCRKCSKPESGQVQPSPRKALLPSLASLKICLRNIMCFFGPFLCSCVLPPVPEASCLKGQISGFFCSYSNWPPSPLCCTSSSANVSWGHSGCLLLFPLFQSTTPISLIDLFQCFKFNLPVVNLAYSKSEVLTLIVRFFQYLKVSSIVFD